MKLSDHGSTRNKLRLQVYVQQPIEVGWACNGKEVEHAQPMLTLLCKVRKFVLVSLPKKGVWDEKGTSLHQKKKKKKINAATCLQLP